MNEQEIIEAISELDKASAELNIINSNLDRLMLETRQLIDRLERGSK